MRRARPARASARSRPSTTAAGSTRRQLRRGQAHDVGEARHERAQLLGARDDHAQRVFEVRAVVAVQLHAVGEARVEQRVATRRPCCSPRATASGSASRRPPSRSAAALRSAPRAGRSCGGSPDRETCRAWRGRGARPRRRARAARPAPAPRGRAPARGPARRSSTPIRRRRAACSSRSAAGLASVTRPSKSSTTMPPGDSRRTSARKCCCSCSCTRSPRSASTIRL